ncbi:divergent polysaccharide deacetylase family protein [Pseudooceanicola sp. 200-1SW]|uniref:divergent polysaccharide deacetylase family protein n=1 Tax=Pseudooceanicola sp. 200-1SW TaxID=3425949 RepID=UPI003D7FC4FC
MARGTISGFVWGTLLSGMALATASLTSPPPGYLPAPARSQPPQSGAGTPEATEADPAAEGATATPPAPEEGAEAAREDSPGQGTSETPPQAGAAEVAPGSEFNRDAGDALPVLPEGDATDPGSAAPRPLVTAPEASPPAAQSDSAPAPDVAQALAQPQGTEGGAEPAPLLEGAADPARPAGATPEVSAPAPGAQPEPTPEGAETGTEVGNETGTAAVPQDPTPPEGQITLPAAGFPQADLDAITAGPPSAGAAAPAALPSPAAEPVAPPRLPQIGDDAPEIQTPAPEEEASAAPRLPGQGASGPLTERGNAVATDTAAAAVPLPPIEAFAAPYDAADPRPRMAIVLIDEGDTRVSINSLRSFPYPLSFAIDASRPDAALAMQAYRAAGFEVLLRADLPEGATPADVENAAQTWGAQVPEAVAVMEEGPSLLQRGSATSEQLAEALAASGHGLLLYPEGLDTARKLALREGVPAATLFRDFDAQGEDDRVIRRFLDYAALKAGQEGGVVMVGRLRPETVSALLVWGLADRADQVHLVPVSAVLTEGLAP